MATQQMIVGLYSSAPGSGKTTLAQFLADAFDFQPVSFAAPLKRMTRCFLQHYGISGEVVDQLMTSSKETPIPKLNNKSVRELMQTLGKEWGRNLIAKDVWVRALFEWVGEKANIVIDDVRFVEEYQAIKIRGGQVWKIIRPCAKLPNTHPSEGLLEGFSFDRTLYNCSTLPEFYQQILRSS